MDIDEDQAPIDDLKIEANGNTDHHLNGKAHANGKAGEKTASENGDAKMVNETEVKEESPGAAACENGSV